MRHNNFKFTIKLITTELDNDSIKEYFQFCGDELPQKVIKIGEVVIGKLRENAYIAYLSIQVLDYGIAQIGINLMASWIEQLYKNMDGFIIDAVIVHPKANPPANGAIIKWDYVNNRPIIKYLQS